ncbi:MULTISPECIES: sugar O-acetyltransferase [unclassified Shewanella]|uniref:sugar O-acetyltransferase n=1 Tax=unclassified Shewanella TaxID=196818 RepID=UPI001BB80CF7|nr:MULTISPECIES: sugar O-acetyltransferase [unclassified Shewanella]GIU15371.1 acetyltransferase [Shewanella sp. MBTL60-112-B1]GIU34816.1 acetyltransferase [Shewanella sp. MBTL60-112-B2]
MTEYEKMLNGEVFEGADPEISAVRDNAYLLQKQISNSLGYSETQCLIKQLLNNIGEGSIVREPFSCEFGKQITIGKGSFINIGAVMLDGAKITIGNHVMVGPSCQFYTASHALDHMSRRRWETFCLPITIEDDVWIGGNVVINQGVTIGARSIVAAGAVVNKDVPADCMVGGVPARVLKKLNTTE